MKVTSTTVTLPFILTLTLALEFQVHLVRSQCTSFADVPTVLTCGHPCVTFLHNLNNTAVAEAMAINTVNSFQDFYTSPGRCAVGYYYRGDQIICNSNTKTQPNNLNGMDEINVNDLLSSRYNICSHTRCCVAAKQPITSMTSDDDFSIIDPLTGDYIKVQSESNYQTDVILRNFNEQTTGKSGGASLTQASPSQTFAVVSIDDYSEALQSEHSHAVDKADRYSHPPQPWSFTEIISLALPAFFYLTFMVYWLLFYEYLNKKRWKKRYDYEIYEITCPLYGIRKDQGQRILEKYEEVLKEKGVKIEDVVHWRENKGILKGKQHYYEQNYIEHLDITDEQIRQVLSDKNWNSSYQSQQLQKLQQEQDSALHFNPYLSMREYIVKSLSHHQNHFYNWNKAHGGDGFGELTDQMPENVKNFNGNNMSDRENHNQENKYFPSGPRQTNHTYVKGQHNGSGPSGSIEDSNSFSPGPTTKIDMDKFNKSHDTNALNNKSNRQSQTVTPITTRRSLTSRPSRTSLSLKPTGTSSVIPVVRSDNLKKRQSSDNNIKSNLDRSQSLSQSKSLSPRKTKTKKNKNPWSQSPPSQILRGRRPRESAAMSMSPRFSTGSGSPDFHFIANRSHSSPPQYRTTYSSDLRMATSRGLSPEHVPSPRESWKSRYRTSVITIGVGRKSESGFGTINSPSNGPGVGHHIRGEQSIHQINQVLREFMVLEKEREERMRNQSNDITTSKSKLSNSKKLKKKLSVDI